MIRTSDSVVNIAAALVKAQAELTNAPKETKGQVGSAVRFYTDLPTLTDHVRPTLAKHELAYVQFPCNTLTGNVGLCTRLLHASGEWLEDEYSMPAGQGAQGAGSALTYARRYALMAVLGIAADDDDGAAASQATRPARKALAVPPQMATGNGASEAQITKMAILFGNVGIKDRADRLAFIAAASRKVESSKYLTKAEAGAVLDALTEVDAGRLDFVWVNGQIELAKPAPT